MKIKSLNAENGKEIKEFSLNSKWSGQMLTKVKKVVKYEISSCLLIRSWKAESLKSLQSYTYTLPLHHLGLFTKCDPTWGTYALVTVWETFHSERLQSLRVSVTSFMAYLMGWQLPDESKTWGAAETDKKRNCWNFSCHSRLGWSWCLCLCLWLMFMFMTLCANMRSNFWVFWIPQWRLFCWIEVK